MVGVLPGMRKMRLFMDKRNTEASQSCSESGRIHKYHFPMLSKFMVEAELDYNER